MVHVAYGRCIREEGGRAQPVNTEVLFSHHLDVDAVSDYFIHHDMRRPEPDVTPLKLQKLLYLAQANYLASTDSRMFDEPVEAFDHGPVVYNTYRRYGGAQIIATREDCMANVGHADDTLPEDVQLFLDEVWTRYKDLSASQLRYLTHQQAPWKDHYSKGAYRQVIPDEDMAKYFRQAVPAEERVFHVGVALVPAGFLESLDEDEIADQMRSFWS